ncbi:hypothetical protein [Phenylobacterium kunshanense]|uniref:Uncharacterized protein n=1 Tax=Phenylobacterium kunshanense TaxID=1445034 RepID=A0A328BIW3_9CAUL|nr:hypothetical protein [Phenylobacterium kunshanense]RAK64968.1 hypothetical protein DJ019_13260 [Phenylobacterium kunshanense]
MTASRDLAIRRAEAKAEILRRVAAGEQTQAVCADHGVHVATVSRWTAADPAFAEGLAAARATGLFVRSRMFRAGAADQVLARLAAGQPLRVIGADPAMPSVATIRHWMRTQIAFGEEARRIIKDRQALRAQLLKTPGPHRPNAVAPPVAGVFDPDLADQVVLRVARGTALKRLRRADPAMPAYPVILAWRRAQPDFDAALRFATRMARSVRARARRHAALPPLIEAIREGHTVGSAAGRHGLPPRRTLCAWIAQDSDFARRLAAAYDDREELIADLMADAVQDHPGLSARALRHRLAPLTRLQRLARRRPGKKWLR